MTAGPSLDGKTSRERRCFLTSLPADPALLAWSIRAHRGIENRLHWMPDVTFRGDESRVRTGLAAEDFALPRHLALNPQRQEQTTTIGVKGTRLRRG